MIRQKMALNRQVSDKPAPGKWLVPSLALLVALVVVYLWAFQFLPITDLSEYMLTARVLTEHGKPGDPYQGFFEPRPSHTPFAVTYFWSVRLLSPFLSVDSVTRLYLSLAMIVTVVGLFCWLRLIAPGHEVQCAPATVLLYGFFLHIGFIPYLFGIGFVFLAMAVGHRLMTDRAGRLARLLLLAGLLMVIYLSHVLTFLVAGLMLLVQTALVGWRRLPLLALAFAPAAALFGYFLLVDAQSARTALDWRWGFYPFHFTSLALCFNAMYDLMTSRWVYLPEFLAIWGGIAICMALGIIMAGKGRFPWRLGAVAAVMLIASVALPSSVGPGIWIAFHIAYPAAFLLVAAAPAGWSRKPVLRVVVLLLCLAAPVAEFVRTSQYNDEMKRMSEVLERVPPRQAVQPIITDLEKDVYPTRVNLHAASWYNLSKGGANPYSFARFDYFPIRYAKVLFPKVPGEATAGGFRYDLHQKGTDYFLVRTQDARILRELETRMALVASSGRWRAYGPNPGK